MKLTALCGCFALSTALFVACGDSGDEDDSGGTSGSGGQTAGKGGSTSGKGGSTSGKGGSTSGQAGGDTGGDGNVGEAGASAGGAPAAGGANGNAGSVGEAGASGGSDTGLGGGANCPDVFGDYDIVSAEGTCGDFDDQVVQQLAGTDVVCTVHFVSEGALNSAVAIDENGDFSGEQLYVGSDQRSPCSGEYDAGQGTMVVTCGGVGDACTVTLEAQ